MAPVAYVVGIGPGMGTAIAKRFGREGYEVAGFARKQATLDEARHELGRHGVRNHMFTADAGNPESLRGALDLAKKKAGPPEILVYNVSVLRQGHASRVGATALVEDFQSNVVGAAVSAQWALEDMRGAKRGTLLFTGGGTALEPFPQYASLSIGKAAMRSLALSLSKELAPEGIHAATVTICGMVKPGTHFDPEAIAEHFWQLHDQAPAAWEAERLYK
ncbi:MAG: SDR family NAD(P)-dependent oxidoreductase [Polyangiales bacterium]